MKTTGLNGSPKYILEFIPHSGFWVNLVFGTMVYLFVSVRFFGLTATLGDAVVRKEPREQAIVAMCCVAMGAISWATAGILMTGAID